MSVGVLRCLIDLWECKGASMVVLGVSRDVSGCSGAQRCSRVYWRAQSMRDLV